MKTKSVRRITILALTLVLALALAACSTAEPEDTSQPAPTEAPAEPTEAPAPTDEPMEEDMAGGDTIVDVAAAAGDFTTLLAAAEAAGLAETLASEGPFTVFAPTDTAFAALGEETIAALLADPEALSEILLYHVVAGEVLAADVVGLDSATTVQGEPVEITVEGDTVMVNDATVTATDIMASNGVIHVIDAVILPPSMQAAELPSIAEVAASDENFSTLVAALEAAGLTDTLAGEGPFTVFAPTDDAFAALGEETIAALLEDPEGLSQILLYHVVPGALMAEDVVAEESLTTVQGEPIAVTVSGEQVMLNDATVTIANVEAGNGVIHVIDVVLLPPSLAEAELPTIAEIAASNADFSTLLAAVEAAGLTETLAGEGPFTVFAPTNAAFEALGAETIDALLADPEQLSSILLYHVAPGEFLAEDVVALPSIGTVAGFPAAITVSDAGAMINGANIVATDIAASNGVVHVIDAVILPPTNNIVEIAAANEDFSTLVAAVEAAGLAETLSGEGPFTVLAPTNAAFEALGQETIDALLADPEALSNVLLYHVLEGNVFSAAVAELESATTLNGQDVQITVDENGNVFINEAQVVTANIIATNGVIHVLDAVLVPAASE